MVANSPKKICFVATVEFAVSAFLLEHFHKLSKSYDLTLLVNTNNARFLEERGLHQVKVVSIPIKRSINILSDLYVLYSLAIYFKEHQFDAVHSITPKAGLLANLAASFVHVNHRIHTFTGQVWATKSGCKRLILKGLDKIIAQLTTHNLVDSYSQKNFLVNEGVLNEFKSSVIGPGSISGVNLKRFESNTEKRNVVRKNLDLPDDAFVILYLGRLALDKGVIDLANAFNLLDKFSHVYLMYVGPDEGRLVDQLKSIVLHSNRLRFVDYTKKPEEFINASNVLCLPSYREGFGNVVIEAAACGVPGVVSNIYGLSDAIVDQFTGLFFEVGNVEDMSKKLEQLIVDEDKLKLLSINAKSRAIKYFNSEVITEGWLSFYNHILNNP